MFYIVIYRDISSIWQTDLVAVSLVCSKYTIHYENMKVNRRGFNCKLKISCSKVDFVEYFQTSKDCTLLEKGTSGMHLSVINFCSVVSFW